MSDTLRWIIDSYRNKLLAVAPTACFDLDDVMRQVGQGWVCDNSIVDPEELVTTQDVVDRYGISKAAIQAFTRRNNVKIRGRDGKSYVYRLGDILSARAGIKKYE